MNEQKNKCPSVPTELELTPMMAGAKSSVTGNQVSALWESGAWSLDPPLKIYVEV